MKSHRPLYLLWLFIHFFSFFCWGQPTDSLLYALNSSKDDTEKIKTLIELTHQCVYYDYDEQFEYAYQAKTLLETSGIKNDTLEAKVLYAVGSGYEGLEQNEEALKNLEKAAGIAERLGLKRLKLRLANLQGLIYDKTGRFDLAIEHFQKGLELAEALDSRHGASTLTNNIALIYMRVKEFRKAEELLSENLETNQALSDKHGEAIAWSNLGDLNQEEGHLDKAIDFYKRSLAIVDSMGLNFGRTVNHLHLAEVYSKKGFQELALSHSELAYEIAQNGGFKQKIAKTALSIAKVKLAQKDYSTSINRAKEALSLTETLDSKEDVFEIHHTLSKNYEALGNFKAALKHHQKFEAIRDSFFDEQKVAVFAELEYRFGNKKKEAENKFLKAEQLKNETIIQQRTALIWAIGIGLILLGLIVRTLYLQNRQKQANNQQLEEQVAERTQYLKTSNEQLTAANKELEQFAYITSHDLKEPLRNISGFSSLISRNIRLKKYDELEEYLQFINKNTRQMSNLIDDILTYSKIGNTDFSMESISLSEVVNRVKTDLHPLIAEQKGRIIYHHPELYENAKHIRIPEPAVLIFKNLIENGLKYNKDESPTVRIGYRLDGDCQIFSIRDNGIGIEKKYHNRVFKMFKRLHHRGEYEGSGIGLAICKKLVESLNGNMRIVQSDERGSVFEVSIPLNGVPANGYVNLEFEKMVDISV